MISPYMDMLDLAQYLCFRTKDRKGWSGRAALEWCDRHHVPTKTRGRGGSTVLVRKDDVEAALQTRGSGPGRRSA